MPFAALFTFQSPPCKSQSLPIAYALFPRYASDALLLPLIYTFDNGAFITIIRYYAASAFHELLATRDQRMYPRRQFIATPLIQLGDDTFYCELRWYFASEEEILLFDITHLEISVSQHRTLLAPLPP